MTEKWEDNFEALLNWLGPDRETAGQKYEEIRHSLINIFDWRGCYDSEDLADETIIRVARKLPDISHKYAGDPALYFYGVAKRLLYEVGRRDQNRSEAKLPEQFQAPTQEAADEEQETALTCLDRCLAELPVADRELILLYYQKEEKKIDYRRALAKRAGLSTNNLRVKVHRLRATLHTCMTRCLKK